MEPTLAEFLKLPLERWVDAEAEARRALLWSTGGYTHIKTWHKKVLVSLGFPGEEEDLNRLALASIDPDGKRRESAVVGLARLTVGEELPFLLLRLNDWVAPVRRRAKEAVQDRLRASYDRQWLRCLPLVARVCMGRRDDHRWLGEGVQRVLGAPESRLVLWDGLHSPNRLTRRACLQLVVTGSDNEAREALNVVLDDPDPATCHRALRRLLQISEPKEVGRLYSRFYSHPYMPVRREVLLAVVERKLENAETALREALLDPHASMREYARFELRSNMDVAGFYRRALAVVQGHALAVAVRGLGECGAKSDLPAIAAYVSHVEARVREGALRAVARLDPEPYLNDFVEAVLDPSNRVARAAVSVLGAHVRSMPMAVINRFAEDPSPRVRGHALELIGRLSKWDQLPAVLRACRDPAPELAGKGRILLTRWLDRYNWSWLLPSMAQREIVVRELAASLGTLPAPVATRLREMVRFDG